VTLSRLRAFSSTLASSEFTFRIPRKVSTRVRITGSARSSSFVAMRFMVWLFFLLRPRGMVSNSPIQINSSIKTLSSDR
jgi:hypothetical protein